MPARTEPVAFFTIGYEGRSLDDFITTLLEAGVDRIVDVRELPLSRKRGFSKRALAEALAEHGIEYVHVRAAGNPTGTSATTSTAAWPPTASTCGTTQPCSTR